RRAWGVGGCARTVRAERNVVSCWACVAVNSEAETRDRVVETKGPTSFFLVEREGFPVLLLELLELAMDLELFVRAERLPLRFNVRQRDHARGPHPRGRRRRCSNWRMCGETQELLQRASRADQPQGLHL